MELGHHLFCLGDVCVEAQLHVSVIAERVYGRPGAWC